jgi:alpha-L-arabinofuranosidase
MGEVVLDAYVDCETHDLRAEESSWPHRVADLGPFELLDVSATCDAQGQELTLVVVNRDPEREIESTIELQGSSFGGAATVYEVTGKDPAVTNDFGREKVGVGERSIETGGRSFEHAFPSCSVTVLRAGVAE